MTEETVQQTQRLQRALASVGVTAGNPRINFNVMLNAKQATDHLAHVELTGPLGKTRVVVVAGEHKGAGGISKGQRQLESMAETYKNKTVYTETDTLNVGSQLHLDLGRALEQIGVTKKEDIKKVLAAMEVGPNAPPYRRVIIYPPGEDAVKGADETVDNIRRVAHEAPRHEMEEVYRSLTLFFNLFPSRW